MATTPAPLVWDFYRQQSSATNLAGVVHYYDTEAQSLYLTDSGVATKISEVEEGHWKDSEESDQYDITEDGWTSVRIDHPSNGIWYGAATDGDTVQFIRYMYATDISAILNSWELSLKSDSPVVQLDAEIQNVETDMFASDSSIFQPGARIPVKVRLGDSEPYLMATTYMDELEFDISSETVSISARNNCGWLLKDQTFNETTSFSGTVKSVLEDILDYAGVSLYEVEDNDTSYTIEFKASDDVQSGIDKIIEGLADSEHEYMIDELEDGTIVIGRDDWIKDYIPQSVYSFNEGSDVFTRKTTKTNDAAYSKIYVTGKDADGADLTPVLLDVNCFDTWVVGSNKTNHITAPDGMTQDGLQAYAESEAIKLQYVGIGDTFSSPFKPDLLIGDIAATKNDDETSTALGLITEVKHKFSRSEGFKTEFSLDSGGEYTGGEYSIYSKTAKVNGYNRRQNIMDIVKMAVSQSKNAVTSSDLTEITPEEVSAIWNSL